MKIYSIYTILVFLASITSITAGTFEIGPDITASDLANQLGVHSASMIYRQEKPFSRITVGLLYKTRSKEGKLEEKRSLVYTTYTLPSVTKEQEIKILFNQDRSTIIVGSVKSTGKGVEMPPPNALMNPPHLIRLLKNLLVFEEI